MGFTDRIKKVLGDLYNEYSGGEKITETELVVIIQDRLDVMETTAKKYIKNMEKRNLIEPDNQMLWTVKPFDEIPKKFKPSK